MQSAARSLKLSILLPALLLGSSCVAADFAKFHDFCSRTFYYLGIGPAQVERARSTYLKSPSGSPIFYRLVNSYSLNEVIELSKMMTSPDRAGAYQTFLADLVKWSGSRSLLEVDRLYDFAAVSPNRQILLRTVKELAKKYGYGPKLGTADHWSRQLAQVREHLVQKEASIEDLEVVDALIAIAGPPSVAEKIKADISVVMNNAGIVPVSQATYPLLYPPFSPSLRQLERRLDRLRGTYPE